MGDRETWPEPLHRRYMGGIKCDMKTGPCSCGAWHHPASGEFVPLTEEDLRWALERLFGPGRIMKMPRNQANAEESQGHDSNTRPDDRRLKGAK